jgi:hypothetical protein
MMLEADKCKNAAYCEKDALRNEILQMRDCRTCIKWVNSFCSHARQCVNADLHISLVPIQAWLKR